MTCTGEGLMTLAVLFTCIGLFVGLVISAVVRSRRETQ